MKYNPLTFLSRKKAYRFFAFLDEQTGYSQLHIKYKNLLIESFNPLITHIYFIQKDKSEVVNEN